MFFFKITNNNKYLKYHFGNRVFFFFFNKKEKNNQIFHKNLWSSTDIIRTMYNMIRKS